MNLNKLHLIFEIILALIAMYMFVQNLNEQSSHIETKNFSIEKQVEKEMQIKTLEYTIVELQHRLQVTDSLKEFYKSKTAKYRNVVDNQIQLNFQPVSEEEIKKVEDSLRISLKRMYY